jgi:hypothetical protein
MPANPIPLEGRLDVWKGSFDVPELLLSICSAAGTGRLTLDNGEFQKKIYVQDGRIVFASSASPDDRLGVYLMLRNEIALADLKRLSPQVRPGVRLGTLLVQEGVLAPDRLIHAVSGQVRAIILSLFRWSQASYHFEAETPSKDEAITLNIPTARIIVDGVELIDSWYRISRGIGALDGAFEMVAGHEDDFRKVDLGTESLEILAMLQHPKGIEEICASTDLPDMEVCRKLWAFSTLGWVRAATVAAAPVDAASADEELDMDLEGLGMILGDNPLGRTLED